MKEIIISIVCSLIASYLFFRWLNFRENRIKKKIEDIEWDEKFVEKISKGNIALLRTTFFIILISIACFSISLLIISILLSRNIEDSARKFLGDIAICFLFVSIGLCVLQARSIIWASNLKDTKRKFQEKREALQKKIAQH